MPWITLRWVAIAVFVFSTAINYLDRLLLAAAAPTLLTEFHLTNADYGRVIAATSIVYALSAPLMGLLIDRAGLNTASTLAIGTWSLAGAATGLVRGLPGLVGTRIVVAIAEAAGIPAFGKANATYLTPPEFAFGTAANQVGISMGMVAAPLLVLWIGPRYGWQSAFFVSGLLGFVWIPIWLLVARVAPKQIIAKATVAIPLTEMIRDVRLWIVAGANIFAMTAYTLWTNWTTIYFVHDRGLTQNEANSLAWIPPIFATAGAFGGAWIAFRLIKSGVPVLHARWRVCVISGLLVLCTASVPFMPNPAWATIAIGLSLGSALAMSVNIYALPIDLFGSARAGFGVSALTFSYGLLQTVISPLIGSLVDHYGFESTCIGISVMPLIAVALLRLVAKQAVLTTA